LVRAVRLDLDPSAIPEGRLRLRLALLEAMRDARDPLAAMVAAAEATGRYWRADSVGFTTLSEDGRALVVEAEWTPDATPRFTGRHELERLDAVGAALAAGETVDIPDILHDERLPEPVRQGFAAAGAQAILAVPLLRDGALRATLFVHQCSARKWTDEDVALAEEALAATREAVERLKAEREALAARERLDLIESSGLMGILDRNYETGAQHWSAGLLRLFGLKPERFAPSDALLKSLVHPDEADALVAQLAAPSAGLDELALRFRLRRPDGARRLLALDARLAPGPDGRPARMTGIVRDVTEEQRRIEAEAEAERRRRFLLALGDRLRLPVDPLDVMSAAAATLGEHFGIGRIGFSEVSADGTALSTWRDLLDTGRPPVPGPFPLADYGPALVERLRSGETAVLPDVRTDPLTAGHAAVFASHGIGAQVVVPVMKGGKLVATFDINAEGPRAWTGEEVAAAELVAERAGAAFDRVRAEAALRENERLLSAIGDSSTDLIFAKDREGRLLYANPATLAVIGRAPEEARGLAQADFTAIEAEGAAIAANDQQVMTTGEAMIFEEPFTDGSGKRILFLSSKAPMRDGTGEVTGLVGVARDITDLRRQEQALRESEARFRALADNIPILCWMADAEGHIFWYNNRWYEYTGTDFAAMEGWGWQSVHDPAILPAVLERWRASLDSGRPFEMLFPLKGADGRFRPFLTRVAPIAGADGRIERWFGTNTDVSEIEKLKRTEALHDLILESATDVAIVTLDMGARVTSWNRGAERIFGYMPSAIEGEPVARLFGSDEDLEIAAATRARATRDGRAEHESFARRADGSRVWVGGVTMPLRDADGADRGFLVIATDRSEARRQEEARKLLVDELNHRVKNSLAIVQALARQSFRRNPATADAGLAFEARLAALAQAHHVLTRKNWEAADLADLVADVTRAHDAAGRLTGEGPPVRLDPETSVTLAMVLHELATNARKYGALANETGTIAVRWARESEGFVRLSWTEAGGPPVAPPAARGFGSRLIARAFPGPEAADLDFAPEGVRCRLMLPVVAPA
jgi:PAS domain S-box-containing protein